MATLHLQLPRLALSDVRRETIGWRDSAILCIAVAVCCAASVFALLCKFQPTYPVAPIQQPVIAASVTPAPISQTPPAQVVEAQPAFSVAHTHNELLALERLGERNYIEFSIARNDGFQPVGPIELGFWRADGRDNSAEASVLLGQRRLDLRRVNVDERILIPVGHTENLELVINRVTKNQIGGYLSEPKENHLQLAGLVGSVLR